MSKVEGFGVRDGQGLELQVQVEGFWFWGGVSQSGFPL